MIEHAANHMYVTCRAASPALRTIEAYMGALAQTAVPGQNGPVAREHEAHRAPVPRTIGLIRAIGQTAGYQLPISGSGPATLTVSHTDEATVATATMPPRVYIFCTASGELLPIIYDGFRVVFAPPENPFHRPQTPLPGEDAASVHLNISEAGERIARLRDDPDTRVRAGWHRLAIALAQRQVASGEMEAHQCRNAADAIEQVRALALASLAPDIQAHLQLLADTCQLHPYDRLIGPSEPPVQNSHVL